MFIYKHTETLQTLRVNNSRIVKIKNAKFLRVLFLYGLEHIGKFSNVH